MYRATCFGKFMGKRGSLSSSKQPHGVRKGFQEVGMTKMKRRRIQGLIASLITATIFLMPSRVSPKRQIVYPPTGTKLTTM
jgi:hypothetical protein